MPDIGHLIEAEIPRLRRYARALIRYPDRADDLVQDTVLRALEKSHLWQPGTDLRAWLFTVMHNQHVNTVRRSVRRGPQIDVDNLILETPATQMASLQLRDLQRALDRLPDEQREVVLLSGLEGLRYEEIAEVLAVPVGTVRSRLSRAREALRQMVSPPALAEANGYEPERRGRSERTALAV